MFSLIVFIQQGPVHFSPGIQQPCFPCHFRHSFQYHRMVYRFIRIFTPSEGPMVFDKYRRHIQGIDFPSVKGFCYDLPCIPFIIAPNFLFCHVSGTGNRAIEIVGVSGSQDGYVLSCLGKNSGMEGVGMDDASNDGKSVI